MEYDATAGTGQIGRRAFLRRMGLMVGAAGLLAACGQQPAAPAKPAETKPAETKPAVNCNPPYYFEGDKKIFKPECV